MAPARLPILGTAVLLVLLGSQVVAEPISTLYLTAGDQDRLFLIDGTDITAVTGAGTLEYAIAVGSDVRTLSAYTRGERGGPAGARYNLSLTPSGATYENTFGSQLIDGTTDGTFNYTVQWSTGQVVRFDASWADGQVVATGLEPDTIGITYDPFSQTFWTASRTANTLSRFSRTWSLLDSFDVTGGPTGLAFDPADRTLWLLQQHFGNQLAQYSTTGVLVSSVSYAQVSETNTLGAEFALNPVPEPTTMLLFGTGLIVAGVGRRRRKQAQG